MLELRPLITAAALVIAAVPGSFAQPKPRPEFEAAAIKPNDKCADGRRSGGSTSPGRITIECAELRDLILTAYAIFGGDSDPASFRMQVTGGPPWVDAERFDFTLKAVGTPPFKEMYGPMLQALLEDRFKLKVHRETRERPVYFLTPAKSGPKLRATKEGSCAVTDDCGKVQNIRAGEVEMRGVTTAELTAELGMRLDRDVIDKTGLTGRFDIHLEVPEADWEIRFVAGGEARETGPVSADDMHRSALFNVLQEQLGLKLEAGRGLLPGLVIDSIEHPSAN